MLQRIKVQHSQQDGKAKDLFQVRELLEEVHWWKGGFIGRIAGPPVQMDPIKVKAS